jgi:hypothetical protein
MCRSGSRHCDGASVELRVVQIAGLEAAREPERAQRLEHEPCKVATRSGLQLQSFPRRLRAFDFPSLVAKGVANRIHHLAQHSPGVVRGAGEKAPTPRCNAAVRIVGVRPHERGEVRPLVRGVLDRKHLASRLDLTFRDTWPAEVSPSELERYDQLRRGLEKVDQSYVV